jgi:hypothetical protein
MPAADCTADRQACRRRTCAQRSSHQLLRYLRAGRDLSPHVLGLFTKPEKACLASRSDAAVLNPQRILIAAEAVGLGRAALARAARYAKERVVFGRPIGQNQAIQHPLAERWIQLEAAELMVLHAAAASDRGEEAGPMPTPPNTVPPRPASGLARLR